MGICIASGAKLTFIAASSFTLAWTHSVQKTEWQEDWRTIGADRLELTQARVQGSGAGMEPPEGSRLVDGWWRYRPRVPTLPALHLADVGAEAGRWRLCTAGACRDLVGDGGTITIRACHGAPAGTACRSRRRLDGAAP